MYRLNRGNVGPFPEMRSISVATQPNSDISPISKKLEQLTKLKHLLRRLRKRKLAERKVYIKPKKHFILEQYTAKEKPTQKGNPGRMVSWPHPKKKSFPIIQQKS